MFNVSSWSGRLYAVACAAMFVFGIALALPGTVFGLANRRALLGLVASRLGLRLGLLLLVVVGVATAAVTRRAHAARRGTT